MHGNGRGWHTLVTLVLGLALRARLGAVLALVLVAGPAHWEAADVAGGEELAVRRGAHAIAADLAHMPGPMLPRILRTRTNKQKKHKTTSVQSPNKTANENPLSTPIFPNPHPPKCVPLTAASPPLPPPSMARQSEPSTVHNGRTPTASPHSSASPPAHQRGIASGLARRLEAAQLSSGGGGSGSGANPVLTSPRAGASGGARARRRRRRGEEEKDAAQTATGSGGTRTRRNAAARIGSLRPLGDHLPYGV